MPGKKAGISVRLWISEDDQKLLRELSDNTQLSQVEIMTRILHSGVEAVSERGFLTLPLRFKIASPEDSGRHPRMALNEGKKKGTG